MSNPDIKRSVGKGQIIHTCLKEMLSVESDFPSSNPTPGVLARAVYHHGEQKVVVELYHESPLIISPGKGDFIDCDPDTVDSKVRELILNIAERCKTQGEELLQHADRLLEIASKENIIDEIDKDRVKERSGYVGGVSLSGPSYNVASVTGSSKSKPKQGRPRIKHDDLLSMLAENDEEDTEGTGDTGGVESGEVEDIEEEEDTEEDAGLLDCLLDED